MDNVKLFSSKFEISESEQDPDVYIGKFIICDFDPNKNDVQINRENAEELVATLIDKPLVGKVTVKDDGTKDFSSHNMKLVTKVDDFGNEYQDVEFDTSAFGTFFDAGIEKIDGVEYITASTKIWKRFTEACEVIKERAEKGTLSTSWEIGVSEYHMSNYMGRTIKVIDSGTFCAHCVLGKDVIPAFESSKLLDVASKSTDIELKDALIKDLYETSEKECDNLNVNNIEKPVVAEVSTTETAGGKGVVESSSLTEYDLIRKIEKACEKKLEDSYCYVAYHFPLEKIVWIQAYPRESELDYKKFTYEANGDNITVSEPEDVKLTVSISEVNSKIEELSTDISARDVTILELKGEVSKLEKTVESLNPYKEEFEKAERARIEKEISEKKDALKEKIVNSGVMTLDEIEASEEISSMIDKLDENGVNKLVVDKLIAARNSGNNSVETSATVGNKPTAKVDLNNVGSDGENEKVKPKEFIDSFIRG